MVVLQVSIANAFQGQLDIDPATTTGWELKRRIHEKAGALFPPESLKVIISGRTIKDDATLAAQGIAKDAKALVLKSTSATTSNPSASSASNPPAESAEPKAESMENRLDRIISATEKIASRAENPDQNYDRQFVEIQDSETGEVLDSLDPKDRQYLIKAIALHERGLGFMNKSDLDTAIGCFAKAEDTFHECSPSILTSFDNYAYLCLDYVWANMLKRNINFLEDAADRLHRVEAMFHKVHGPNLERLLRTKKGFCPEKLLYARLHLLQGVVAYHQQKLELSKRLLVRASAELKALDVSEEQLTSLQLMGFGFQESRKALLASEKNLSLAIQFIIQEREKVKEARKKEGKRLREWESRKRIGKTVSGKPVDIQLIVALTEMSFPRRLVIQALKQTDNNREESLRLLLESSDVLQASLDHGMSPPSQQPRVLPVVDERTKEIRRLREEIERLEGVTSTATDDQTMLASLDQLLVAQTRLGELLSLPPLPLPSLETDPPTRHEAMSQENVATHVETTDEQAQRRTDEGHQEAERAGDEGDSDEEFDEEEIETIQQAGKGDESRLDTDMAEEKQILAEYLAYVST